jgi:hypothetical protein
MMFLFGRKEEWRTKTVCGIDAQIVYMLCCLTVCVAVLATVSGRQILQCFFDIAHAVYYAQR